MLIKRLSEKYIDQLINVVEEYREFCGFKRSQEETESFFRNLLVNNEAVTFIAINVEDEVMGFINLYPSYSTLALKRIWIINDLGVLSKFHRLGIARALINEAIKFSKTSGAIRIELKTEKNNLNAQKLYTKVGFQIDQENIYYRVPLEE